MAVYCQDVSNIKFDHLSSENLTYEKGLSQNTVNCMLQDSKGYLWFGKWDSLNNRVNVLAHADGVKTGLESIEKKPLTDRNWPITDFFFFLFP